jgi:hypothetical protein
VESIDHDVSNWQKHEVLPCQNVHVGFAPQGGLGEKSVSFASTLRQTSKVLSERAVGSGPLAGICERAE